MTESLDVASHWWEASQGLRAEPYWSGALRSLGSDPYNRKLLVAGPGRRDPRHLLTLGIASFLQRAGFEAELIEGQLDPDAHRERAMAVPRIVALPLSVGSCAEVLVFAADSELRKRLLVVIPEEHRAGYFARVLSITYEVPIRTCGALNTEGGGEFDSMAGTSILCEVARHIHDARAREVARSHTELAPAESSVQGRSSRVMLSEWLAGKESLRLEDYKVVGRFISGSGEQRAKLLDIVDRLRERMSGGIDQPFPVLVCGSPGAGKSFFVKETAKELGVEEGQIIEDNLSGADSIARALERHYSRIAIARGTRLVAFLDEVDTKVGDDHAYRHLLPALLGGEVSVGAGAKSTLPGVLWFFAASAGSDLRTLKVHLAKIQKGSDFVRRFAEAGATVEIKGPSDPVEVAIMAIALLKSEKPEMQVVDKKLVFLFGAEAWTDAGELKREVKEVARGAGRVKFVQLKHHASSDRLRAAFEREQEDLKEIRGTINVQ